MKKVLCIIIIVTAVFGLVMGTSAFSFAKAERAIENIEDTSNNLLADINGISLYAFTASDFFSGAERFVVNIHGYADSEGNRTGAWFITYASYRPYYVETLGDYLWERVRYEEFEISTENDPLSEAEAMKQYARMTAPITPFLEWERVEYDGVFSEVLRAIQYVGYILGMIWGALSLVLLVLVDTIATAWELITAGLRFTGLT